VEFGLEWIYLMILIFVYLDLLMIVNLLIHRTKMTINDQKKKGIQHHMMDFLDGKSMDFNKEDFLKLEELKKSIHFEIQNASHLSKIKRLEKKYERMLNDLRETHRVSASSHLGMLGTENARKILEKRMSREKNNVVKLYIANALSDIGHAESIPVLIDSLKEESCWYKEKVNALISSFGKMLSQYLRILFKKSDNDSIEFVFDYAEINMSYDLKDYILEKIDDLTIRREKIQSHEEKEIESLDRLIQKGMQILATMYPKYLAGVRYVYHRNRIVQKYALLALSNYDLETNFFKIVNQMQDIETMDVVEYSLRKMLDRKPSIIYLMIERFLKEENPLNIDCYASVLSSKMEYLIMKLLTNEKQKVKDIIQVILLQGKTSTVIDFLNRNQNVDLENELLSIVKSVVKTSKSVRRNIQRYLDSRMLKKNWSRKNRGKTI
jgi:hypothetical protein